MSRQSTMIEYSYSGVFADAIAAYVAEKRGMGILFNSDAKKLKNFDKFTQSKVCEKNVLSKELVLEYTTKTPNENYSNQKYRINTINRFALYMQRMGYEAYCQPNTTRKTTTQFMPYIFCDNEIMRFFQAADEIKATPQHKTYNLVVPLIFRIAYTTGLRSSEIRHLTVKDVDLENGVLSIIGTKFEKDRLVPLSTSITKMCCEYSRQVHLESTSDTPYFLGKCNQEFGEAGLYDLFRRVLWNAGIPHGGTGSGPRMHDFRHTFVVHSLRKWIRNGTDLTVALPYLSAYLGHTGFKSTQQYLKLTTDLYPDILKIVEQNCGYIIPKAGGLIEN